jgi:hypothetical protein
MKWNQLSSRLRQSFGGGRYVILLSGPRVFYSSQILQINTARYPILSHMAIDYLPIQGSPIPCKCVFSDTRLTDTKRRMRLLPDNFGKMQAVKGKYKKEWRCRKAQVVAKRAAEKRHWMDDSVQEVQKQQVA